MRSRCKIEDAMKSAFMHCCAVVAVTTGLGSGCSNARGREGVDILEGRHFYKTIVAIGSMRWNAYVARRNDGPDHHRSTEPLEMFSKAASNLGVMKDEQSQTCSRCRRTIDLGRDVMAVEQGVVGPRGFVPLEDPLLFCGEACLKGHFDDDGDIVEMPRRIP